MRRRLIIVAILLLLPLLTMGWLLFTASGLQAGIGLLTRISGGQLSIEQASGRLYDEVHIDTLRFENATTSVKVQGLNLQWTPAALLHGTLRISALGVGNVEITTRPGAEAAHFPDSLKPPLAMEIEALAIGALRLNGTLIADISTASLQAKRSGYTLHSLDMRREALHWQAQGMLSATPPYALDLSAEVTGILNEQPFALSAKAGGDLQRMTIEAKRTNGPFDFDLQAAVRPFAAQQLAVLNLNAKELDLAALAPDLPRTRINVACHTSEDGKPGAGGTEANPKTSGNCRLDNQLAGPIDQGLLPLARVDAYLNASEDALKISGLRISSGKGVLHGNADWSNAGLNATLNAQALNLAELHGSALPTRLSGPITLTSTSEVQTAQLDLREARLALQARLTHQNSVLALEQLQLRARDASLTTQGQLHTDSRDFSLDGRFDRFDPALFMRLASGRLNGDFKASGKLGDAPHLLLDLRLRNSRLADAPANGHGHIDLAWPHLRKADVALALGSNHIRLNGALGRSGDKLRLDINAPSLTPYGVEGDLQAQIEAAGRLDVLQLQGQARSNLLRLPGQGRIRQLQLDSDIGSSPASRMKLRLKFDRLDLATRVNSVRNFDLDIDGTRRQHQLQLSALLGDDLNLRAAARGSFSERDALDWQGALTQLALNEKGSRRFLRLQDEAELAFGRKRWKIGPAQLKSRNASIHLQANAVPGKLQLAVSANDPAMGRTSLDLSAQPRDVWTLSAQTPWRGRLQASVDDLAWVNDLIGAPWQAGGRLEVDVQIAGTPQLPLLNGHVRGDQLALRQLDTRMQLQNGVLRASIKNSVLTLDELTLHSVLTTPPPTLQRMLGGQEKELIATPGQLSARGRMNLGKLGDGYGEDLSLELTLDRLGVSQTATQWLLLSGQGRVNWQQARLGVEARMNVDAAHWQLADLSRPQLSDDVIVHREGGVSTEAQRPTPWMGTVRVGLGRYFSFSGAGARGRLSGQVQVSASAQDIPRASGAVNLVDGRYEAYGQQLAIERGILNFQGLLENPALNIRALRKGLAVEAGVEITGFAQAPRIRLVSEPNVPDAEKLSWLVLGRAPETGSGDAGVLMTAIGAIFGNRGNAASQQLKDSFGIDELSVRSGTLGQGQAMRSSVVAMSSSAASSQILAVGKQLSDRLRLSYEQALGGAESLIKLTLKLSDRVSVVGTSGTDAALDVFYSFSFGGKAPRRSGNNDSSSSGAQTGRK